MTVETPALPLEDEAPEPTTDETAAPADEEQPAPPVYTTAVARYSSKGVGIKFDNEQKQLIYEVAKRSLTQNSGGEITQAEFDYFLAVCAMRGLNPLLREAHLLKTGDGINVQVGIDGFRSLAEDTGEYAGQSAPYYEVAEPGATITVNIGRDNWKELPWGGRPVYARVEVYRRGAAAPFAGESWIEEDFNGGENGMWRKRPHTMLAKVAEARAIRKAFPRSLSGVYAEGELDAGPRLVGDGPGIATTTPVAAPGAPQLSEGASVPTEGEFRVPEPPAAPSDTGLQGEIVKVDPEGSYRSVKVPWLNDDEPHHKVEVKFTVTGKGKVTAILLDELAEQAAELELANGERLWVDDTKVVLRQWGKPEDKKPPIKELHAIREARVWRDGEWLILGGAAEGGGVEAAADETPLPAPPAEEAPPKRLERLELADGETFRGPVRVAGAKWQTRESDGATFAVLHLTTASHMIYALMDEAEAKAQSVLQIVPGSTVEVLGVGQAGWLHLTAVQPT